MSCQQTSAPPRPVPAERTASGGFRAYWSHGEGSFTLVSLNHTGNTGYQGDHCHPGMSLRGPGDTLLLLVLNILNTREKKRPGRRPRSSSLKSSSWMFRFLTAASTNQSLWSRAEEMGPFLETSSCLFSYGF
uniref:Uncharacterized protein n=1 Tax=Knipowitschia caucasica TaxID=637954 RepID=A0AAV2MJU0_KNICA